MKLQDVGHREVVTALEDDSLFAAAKKMREAHVGDVVVVRRRNARYQPVGMLTDRDIVVATIALKVPLEMLSVGDVMTMSVVSVRENDSLGKVLERMREHGVRRIPVLGRNNELRGIVAIEDIICFLSKQLSILSEIFARERKFESRRRLRIA